jgi:sugar phosphate isomerase/epimerase
MNACTTSLSRRHFLTLAGAAASATLLAPQWLRAATHAQKASVGLELFSVRDELARDLPGTLRQVAAMGYEAVEFFSPYFEWTPAQAKEVRALLDQLGLHCPSTHNHVGAFKGDGLARAIELNRILGSTTVVLAWPGDRLDGETIGPLCDTLAAATEPLATAGLRGGYHNHELEWKRLDNGKRLLDVIAERTPHAFTLQLDVGTCVAAGDDPVAWIKAHPGRIRSIHLKDWAPGAKADEKEFRVLFGEGVSPWREIVTAAESVGGVESYLLEQEGSRFAPFETARRCLENWKAFRSRA